jgi:hypothetical protein
MNDQPLIPEILERLRAQLLELHPDMMTDEQLFTDQIDGSTDVLDKLRRILRHGIEASVFAEALKRHIDTLKQRKARFEAREDACRATVREAMDALGLTRLQSPDFTASIIPGRPRVVVPDVDALPDEFVRTTVEPDLSAIAAALKGGAEVPGASFSNSAPVLTVRRL